MVKLRRVQLWLLAAAGVLACQALAGIDDKELDPNFGAGGNGGGDASLETSTWDVNITPTGDGPVPPERPAGPATPSGKGVKRFFAARNIYLGTVDPATGQKSNSAWKRIGHDVDGECTTAQLSISNQSAVCKRAPSASDEALEDGDNCRDNAAGRLLAFGSQTLSDDFELSLNADLEGGDKATYLLALEDLDSGADDPYVPGALYVTVPTGENPKWNGGDLFALDAQTVGAPPTDGGPDAALPEAAPPDGDAATDGPVVVPITPRFPFPKGYMKGNVWVSGDFGASPMQLPLFVLNRISIVDAATVTLVVELTPAHDAAVVATMSAVAYEPTLQAQFYPVAKQIVGCNDVLAGLFMSQFLLPAMDLAANPPSFRSSSGAACDALSIGFKFDFRPALEPTVVLAAPPATTCP